MSKFSWLEDLAVPGDRIKRFTFTSFPNKPWLDLKPAMSMNKGYRNAKMILNDQYIKAWEAKMKADGRKVEEIEISKGDVVDQERAIERALWPEHVIVGWGNMTDSEGNEVPFSIENAKEFIDALPEEHFDLMRMFASNYEAFKSKGPSLGNSDAGSATTSDTAETAGQ